MPLIAVLVVFYVTLKQNVQKKYGRISEELSKEAKLAIIQFFLKLLTPTQQNYMTFDRELYGIVVSLKKMTHLICSS
jgi:RNase H-like domain found in reverse transcriptase